MDLIQGVDRLYVQGQAYCAKHLFFTKQRKKKKKKKMKSLLCQINGCTEVWCRRSKCCCCCSGDFRQPEGAMESQAVVFKPPHLWTSTFQFRHPLPCSSFFPGWFPMSPMGISNPTTNPPSTEREVVVQIPSGWVPGKEQSGRPNPQQSGSTGFRSTIPHSFTEKKKKNAFIHANSGHFPFPWMCSCIGFSALRRECPSEKPWLLWHPRCQQLVTVWHHWANI